MLPQSHPRATACARCRSPANCLVFELPFCLECHSLWMRDDRFSSGAINAALGVSDRPEDFTEANHRRYVAEATKRTRAWLGESSRGAAA